MRVYWERIGVLGPIYRLAGKGFNDREIADKLNITEITVQGCCTPLRCPVEWNWLETLSAQSGPRTRRT
jgi:hypothetical protein